MNKKDRINEATEYKSPKKETPPSMPNAGYPAKGVKTSGVKQRGSGAAVKGFTSRGPMF